jgi:hypothetical protein
LRASLARSYAPGFFADVVMVDPDYELLLYLKRVELMQRGHASILHLEPEKKQNEWNILHDYLEVKPIAGLLRITPQESPDFVVEAVDGCHAFEITELVDEKILKGHAKRRKYEREHNRSHTESLQEAMSGRINLSFASPLDRPIWDKNRLRCALNKAITSKDAKAASWIEKSSELNKSVMKLIIFTSELIESYDCVMELANDYQHFTKIFDEAYLMVPGRRDWVEIFRLKNVGKKL